MTTVPWSGVMMQILVGITLRIAHFGKLNERCCVAFTAISDKNYSSILDTSKTSLIENVVQQTQARDRLHINMRPTAPMDECQSCISKSPDQLVLSPHSAINTVLEVKLPLPDS